MALVKGENAYVDVAEADDYFSTRLNSTTWSSANTTTKENALITATRLLDEYAYRGEAISVNQPLAFPRFGDYYEPRIGSLVAFSDTELPVRLSNATMELALHLLGNTGILEESSSATNITVGPITIQDIREIRKIPLSIKSFLKPLLAQEPNMWWRAN